MLSVILPRTDEPKVILYTQELLLRELHAVQGAELLVVDSWEEGVRKAKNIFVSLVEPDCLVSSGFFSSNVGLFTKNKYFRQLAMVSSRIGINQWANTLYAYRLEETVSASSKSGIITTDYTVRPVMMRGSSQLYPAQIGFVPGAIIRRQILIKAIDSFGKLNKRDPVQLSTDLSFFFWDSGLRVHINPNTTYVTTSDDAEDPEKINYKVTDRISGIFGREGL